MKQDDPSKPEFASWQSYANFAQRVRRDRRYVWQPEVQAFLDTVLATVKGRDLSIKEGTILYRAQLGAETRSIREGHKLVGEEWVGYGPKRMKPLTDRAKEGRVNPPGIPALYLASSEETAISEVRPWIGSQVSVAQFEIRRELRAINLSDGHGKFAIGHLTLDELAGSTTPSADKKERAVWIHIDCAFSAPVTRSDEALDYVPTQILAELFRSAGYDALVYRSQFGEKGYNVALFDIGGADAINCAPYSVDSLKVTFSEDGNRWYSTKRRKKRR